MLQLACLSVKQNQDTATLKRLVASYYLEARKMLPRQHQIWNPLRQKFVSKSTSCLVESIPLYQNGQQRNSE